MFAAHGGRLRPRYGTGPAHIGELVWGLESVTDVGALMRLVASAGNAVTAPAKPDRAA